MLKFSCSNAMLLMLTSVVVLGSTACSRTTTIKAATESTEVASVASPAPAASPVKPSPTTQPPAATSRADAYKLALEKADSAGNIAISAQSQDDWNLVVSRWQQAIQLMRSIPRSSPYRSTAQTKLTQYQRNLAAAKKQAARAGVGEIVADTGVLPMVPRSYSTFDNKPAAVITNPPPSAGGVYVARIKRRAGGTPIIDVTFNGNRTFEMIVDTGASGTVITREMASALGLGIVGKAKVNTASERGVEVPLAYLDSIAVGRAVVKGVVVAIGNSALDIGLLGHDFFADYDVTVKRNVVEFRQR